MEAAPRLGSACAAAGEWSLAALPGSSARLRPRVPSSRPCGPSPSRLSPCAGASRAACRRARGAARHGIARAGARARRRGVAERARSPARFVALDARGAARAVEAAGAPAAVWLWNDLSRPAEALAARLSGRGPRRRRLRGPPRRALGRSRGRRHRAGRAADRRAPRASRPRAARRLRATPRSGGSEPMTEDEAEPRRRHAPPAPGGRLRAGAPLPGHRGGGAAQPARACCVETAASDAARARALLATWERENRREPEPPPAPLAPFPWLSMALLSGALLGFFAVTGPRADGSEWFAARERARVADPGGRVVARASPRSACTPTRDTCSATSSRRRSSRVRCAGASGAESGLAALVAAGPSATLRTRSCTAPDTTPSAPRPRSSRRSACSRRMRS